MPPPTLPLSLCQSLTRLTHHMHESDRRYIEPYVLGLGRLDRMTVELTPVPVEQVDYLIQR